MNSPPSFPLEECTKIITKIRKRRNHEKLNSFYNKDFKDFVFSNISCFRDEYRIFAQSNLGGGTKGGEERRL